jgi:hypothetical protein
MARSGHCSDNPDESSKTDNRDQGSGLVILRLLLAWCAASMISAPAIGAVLANLQHPAPERSSVRPQLAAR